MYIHILWLTIYLAMTQSQYLMTIGRDSGLTTMS